MSSTNRFPERMTAIEIARPGGPEVLVATSRPLPTPGPREVLVEVRAAGVNGPDVLQRKGVYDPPPGASDIPGLEIAGTVRAVGSEVSLFRPGDRVWYAGDITRPGSNSELHRVDERIAGHLPKSLDFAQAAALPLTTITAWELLFERLQIAECKADQGQSLLVVGAAGGVGSILVQLARQLTGLNVIGTYVHTSRLQYLEFFKQFYAEGGRPWRPLNIATKYVDIKEEE